MFLPAVLTPACASSSPGFHMMCCVCVCFVTQLCPALCDPMDCDPPGSSVHGILQARILEWVAISFSRGSPPPRDEPRSPALQADASPSELLGKALAYTLPVS